MTTSAELEAARPALALALYKDHLYGCEQNTCDIRMAAALGAHYYAAGLLIGATESPATNAVLASVPGWKRWEQGEFAIFSAWYETHTTPCPDCGAHVEYDAGTRMAVCDNCLTKVVAPSPS